MGQSWVSMIMDRLHRVGKDNVKLREEVEHLRPLLSPQFIAPPRDVEALKTHIAEITGIKRGPLFDNSIVHLVDSDDEVNGMKQCTFLCLSDYWQHGYCRRCR